MKSDNPQVNIRLSLEAFEALEAAAFVRHLTPARLLTEVAEAAIDRCTREEPVQEALRARHKAAQADGMAKVTTIENRRTRRRESD